MANSTANLGGTSYPFSVLPVVLTGTGLSAAGSLLIIATFLWIPELHSHRPLWHIVFKAVHVILMSAGYGLNYLPDFNCSSFNWCGFQFTILQLGNAGILTSEAAMACEIFRIIRRHRSGVLRPSKSPRKSRSLQAIYLCYVALAIASVVTGLATGSITCYFGVWCWYTPAWEQFAFKFGIFAAVLVFGFGTLAWLAVMYIDMRKQTSQSAEMINHMARMLGSFLLIHLMAWGCTFAWRLGAATGADFTSNVMLLYIVYFNVAGAGYLDVCVWFCFPAVRKAIRNRIACLLQQRPENKDDAGVVLTDTHSSLNEASGDRNAAHHAQDASGRGRASSAMGINFPRATQFFMHR